MQRGFSIMTVLMGFMVASGMMWVMMRSMNSSFKNQRRENLQGALEDLRLMIYANIDCADTLAQGGINLGNAATQCTSTSANQTAPFIRLRRKGGATTLWMNGSWNGQTSRFGDWTVRTTCSNSEKTLIIRAARPNGSGGFEPDPVTGMPASWSSPSGLVYGTGANVPKVCEKELGAPTPPTLLTCSDPDALMVGIDYNTYTPICRPINTVNVDYYGAAGQKPQKSAQNLDGTFALDWVPGLLIYNCVRWVSGHQDSIAAQFGCPAGWSNNGALGTLYH